MAGSVSIDQDYVIAYLHLKLDDERVKVSKQLRSRRTIWDSI